MAEKKSTTSARLKTRVKPQSNVSVKSKTKATSSSPKAKLTSSVKGKMPTNSNVKIKTKSLNGGKTSVSFTAPRNAKVRIKKV